MAVNVKELFEKHAHEYRKFERIEAPSCSRPDLCAFIRLNQLVPSVATLFAFTLIKDDQRDEIFLGVDLGDLAEVASEADIVTLIRCGLRLREDFDCLAIYGKSPR